MSEQQNEQTPAPAPAEQTPPEPTAEQTPPTPQPAAQTERTGDTSYPLRFIRRETGRTHTIGGGIQTVPITHGETGEPEAEYVLLATIDGADIPLATYNAGRIETQVLAAQRAAKQNQQA